MSDLACNSMNIFFVFLSILFLAHGRRCYCDSSVHIGYQLTLGIPVAYTQGFVGRAFFIQTQTDDDDQMTPPNFKAAITVEASNHNYTCSLDVFLGEVRVWSSGHLSQFYATEKCMLHLTHYGDLQLKAQKEKVGWRTGTSGQGVKRLHLLRTGNLVLVDSMNLIKWQSFNFPTNIMLWGQRLSSETRLTSFPSNSSLFFSFEIQHDKIALYLNSGLLKYSYWEFKPPDDEGNITYVQLNSKGLEVYNDRRRLAAQITAHKAEEAVRFLALGNSTGNLGLYYYSAESGEFEASYQAANTWCDLPLSCKPYGICTFSKTCSCIRVIAREEKGLVSDCSSEESRACDRAEMVELQGATSILRSSDPNKKKKNVSRETCSKMCMEDCKCEAALYETEEEECFLYGMVRGVKEVERDSKTKYMVKVVKGREEEEEEARKSKGGLKKWIVIVVVVADVLIVLLVLGGIGYYYCVYKKRRN